MVNLIFQYRFSTEEYKMKWTEARIDKWKDDDNFISPFPEKS